MRDYLKRTASFKYWREGDTSHVEIGWLWIFLTVLLLYWAFS